MFNAPTIITQIPDIRQIYDINDRQGKELDAAVRQMDDNLFFDSMDDNMISRWESILKIEPKDDDSIDDRRFRIHSKVVENLPYTRNVLVKKMKALCPYGYVLDFEPKKVTIKLVLKSKQMMEDVINFLENILPLDMTYQVSILFNTYKTLSQYENQYLKAFTYKSVRDTELERS